MTKDTVPKFFVLAVFLCLGPGCSAVRAGGAGGAGNGASPVVKELVKSSRSWDGALLPAYPQGQPEITILRIVIPAGAQLHSHHHPVINAGVLLSGELTVVASGGETLHLKAGDPIVELVNKPHYGMNSGTIPAEIVVFYAGVREEPITVVEP